ncbi:MAG TPA: methyltransferase domain-containing protein [Gemmataceae bacterium]|nr:methyltransferase domain-containing protein [Gemmataceae bacterium]
MAFLSQLRERHLQPEWMDRPDLDARQHQDALRGLERLNRWSGSAHILWRPLARLAAETPDRPCRILDIATGGGDVPRGLWRRACRAGISLALEGCDISPVAIAHAQQRCAEQAAEVRFFQTDVLRDPLPSGYDAVISSLFLHHLTQQQAIDLLRRMAAAGRLVLVNDLARSRRGFLLAWFATRILSRSKVVHFDGPRSVEGAFTPDEARRLAEAAGLAGVTVERRWPCRFLLSWRRPPSSDPLPHPMGERV